MPYESLYILKYIWKYGYLISILMILGVPSNINKQLKNYLKRMMLKWLKSHTGVSQQVHMIERSLALVKPQI